MSTLIEIEKAIENLPANELTKLLVWLEEKQSMVAATKSVFNRYDDEEGDELQWHE